MVKRVENVRWHDGALYSCTLLEAGVWIVLYVLQQLTYKWSNHRLHISLTEIPNDIDSTFCWINPFNYINFDFPPCIVWVVYFWENEPDAYKNRILYFPITNRQHRKIKQFGEKGYGWGREILTTQYRAVGLEIGISIGGGGVAIGSIGGKSPGCSDFLTIF